MKKRGKLKKELESEFKIKLIPDSKKAQGIMGMPFATIFSIILIVFFVMVAFMVINAFLNSQKCVQIGIFIDRLNEDVNKAWNSDKDDFEFPGSLPKKIEYACFVDFSKSLRGPHASDDISWNIGIFKNSECGGDSCNLIFYPREKACKMANINVPHIDIEEITKLENPYCIKVREGSVDFRIVKAYGQRLVDIKKVS